MANQEDIALTAHLMRRAGFGASRDELETRAAKGYDATVEELLNPDSQPAVDPYTLLLFSNRHEDNMAIDLRRARGMSIDQAIADVLRERGVAP